MRNVVLVLALGACAEPPAPAPPAGGLEGRVLGPDGRPVLDARVHLFEVSAGELLEPPRDWREIQWRQHGSITSAWTDERGVYRFDDVRPGRWRVRAHADGTWLCASAAIELGEGAGARVPDVVLERAPAENLVRGTIEHDCDCDWSEVVMWWTSYDPGGQGRECLSAEDGSFTVVVADTGGAIDLLVQCERHAAWREGVPVGTTDLRVALGPDSEPLRIEREGAEDERLDVAIVLVADAVGERSYLWDAGDPRPPAPFRVELADGVRRGPFDPATLGATLRLSGLRSEGETPAAEGDGLDLSFVAEARRRWLAAGPAWTPSWMLLERERSAAARIEGHVFLGGERWDPITSDFAAHMRGGSNSAWQVALADATSGRAHAVAVRDDGSFSIEHPGPGEHELLLRLVVDPAGVLDASDAESLFVAHLIELAPDHDAIELDLPIGSLYVRYPPRLAERLLVLEIEGADGLRASLGIDAPWDASDRFVPRVPAGRARAVRRDGTLVRELVVEAGRTTELDLR